MKYFFVILLFVMSFCSFAESDPERILRLVNNFKYSVDRVGVKSLSFKVKVKGLEDSLAKSKQYGNISNLYFDVVWKAPKSIDIEINGIGKGFKELKHKLRMLIYSKIPFIFSNELSQELHGYKLKLKKNTKNKYMVSAEDKSGKKATRKMIFGINSKYQIETIYTEGLSGREITHVESRTFPWSKKKFVNTQVKSIINNRMYRRELLHKVQYESIDGFGLPSSIVTQTFVKRKNEKEIKKINEVVLNFFDYKINN